jgi:ABC-type transport system involved in multi-copper enzyme maturation permease subunit
MKKRRRLTAPIRIAISLELIGFFILLGGFGTRELQSIGGPIIPPDSYISNIVDLKKGQALTVNLHADDVVNLYIMNKRQFEEWKNSRQVDAFIAARNVTQYQLSFSAPCTDIYAIIFDNTSSSFEKNTSDTEWFVSGDDYEMIAAGGLSLFAGGVIFLLIFFRTPTANGKGDQIVALSNLTPSKFSADASRFWVVFKREARFVASFPILELLVLISSYVFLQSSSLFFGGYGGSISFPTGILLTGSVVAVFVQGSLEIYFVLSMIIVAALIAYSVTAERESGTMLLLLSHPLRRHEMLLAKLLAVSLIAWSSMFFPSAIFTLTISARYGVIFPLSLYLVMAISTCLLTMIYSAISLVFSVLADSTLVASLCSFFTFFLWRFMPEIGASQLRIASYSHQIRVITSYLFLEIVPDLREAGMLPGNIGFQEFISVFTTLLIIVALTLVASFLLFNKRDIK